MARKVYVGGAATLRKNGLPMKYKQVAYLQSSGTQFVNSNFYPSGKALRVVIKFKYTASHDGLSLFGNSTNDQFSITVYGSRPVFYVGTSSAVSCGSQTSLNTTYTLDVTANNGTLTAIWNGTKYTASYSGSLRTDRPMFIFGSNNGGAIAETGNGYLLESIQFYDNGTLVRDYIPCVDDDEGGGLYDFVEGKFYGNDGTGTFSAGAEVVTETYEVDNVAMEVKKIYVGVSGVARKMKKGYIGVSGVARKFFETGVPISEFSVGDTVKLNVNGIVTEFIIVHKGIPSGMYDSSCDGAWLLMKDLYEKRTWDGSRLDTSNNDYEKSEIHAYLNGTFISLLDSNIQSAIKQVKIPYHKGTGSGGSVVSGVSGLSTKVFLLSGYEVGWTTSTDSRFPVDGACLSYFNGTEENDSKRIAYYNGKSTSWWLRSPLTYGTYDAIGVYDYNGGYDEFNYWNSLGVRPALILPFDTLVSDDMTIS